jgi:serine/threonine-protein phosphatase with EF-hand domain
MQRPRGKSETSKWDQYLTRLLLYFLYYYYYYLKAFRAVMIIQKWFRGKRARAELKKLTAWKIYQSIEYSGQQDQLKLFNFFMSLIKYGNVIRTNKTQKQNSIFKDISTSNNEESATLNAKTVSNKSKSSPGSPEVEKSKRLDHLIESN